MNKASLPIKTRIAVWWIAIVGLAGTTIWLALFLTANKHFPFINYSYFYEYYGMGSYYTFNILLISLTGFLYLILGILIELKKKWAWALAITLISLWLIFITVGLFMEFEYSTLVAFLAYLIPFVLIFFDRRKYWEMLSIQNTCGSADSKQKQEVSQ